MRIDNDSVNEGPGCLDRFPLIHSLNPKQMQHVVWHRCVFRRRRNVDRGQPREHS